MDIITPLFIAQKIFIGLLGLSLGYHMAEAFRDIETQMGRPGFTAWFIKAVKKATHHYDIGLAIMIISTSLFLSSDPFTKNNAAILLFFMGLAAFWDDRADAPPKELITYAIQILKGILRGKLNLGYTKR